MQDDALNGTRASKQEPPEQPPRDNGQVRLRNLEVTGDLSLDGGYAGSPESMDSRGQRSVEIFSGSRRISSLKRFSSPPARNGCRLNTGTHGNSSAIVPDSSITVACPPKSSRLVELAASEQFCQNGS